jgi:hypothetical protein
MGKESVTGDGGQVSLWSRWDIGTGGFRRSDRVIPAAGACSPDIDAGTLALFAIDAAWVAALCCVQAARSRPTDASEYPPVGRPDLADVPSR